MKDLMRTCTFLRKLIIVNFSLISAWQILCFLLPAYNFSFIILLLLLFNTFFFFSAVNILKKSTKKFRKVIGRKKILTATFCTGLISLSCLLMAHLISPFTFLLIFYVWSVLFMCLQIFSDESTALLHKIFGSHHNVGIVGINEKSLLMANRLRYRKRFSLVKHFNNSEIKSGNGDREKSVYSFADFTKEKGRKELYVSSASEYSSDEGDFFQEANRHCVRINFIDLDTSSEHPSCHKKYVYGMPVWQQYNEPLLRTINHVSKRVMDFFISSLVILFVLSWLIPLIGIVIKTESKGPVFFRQLRSGRDNRSFMCLKFRSMMVNEESDSKQATHKDSRITKIGAFLRQTSLDEFPQFINVFKGEMSIVGPRPHMLRHTEEYSKQNKTLYEPPLSKAWHYRLGAGKWLPG